MTVRKTVSPVPKSPVTEGVGTWGGTGEMVSVRTSEWYEPDGRSLGSGEVHKFMICED